jgi:hypothetical protein
MTTLYFDALPIMRLEDGSFVSLEIHLVLSRHSWLMRIIDAYCSFAKRCSTFVDDLPKANSSNQHALGWLPLTSNTSTIVGRGPTGHVQHPSSHNRPARYCKPNHYHDLTPIVHFFMALNVRSTSLEQHSLTIKLPPWASSLTPHLIGLVFPSLNFYFSFFYIIFPLKYAFDFSYHFYKLFSL